MVPELACGPVARSEYERGEVQGASHRRASAPAQVQGSCHAPRAGPRRGKTAVPLETLHEVGMALARTPADFNLNRKIARQLEAKRKMIETGKDIDWATAEALAFGTLLIEGHHDPLARDGCSCVPAPASRGRVPMTRTRR